MKITSTMASSDGSSLIRNMQPRSCVHEWDICLSLIALPILEPLYQQFVLPPSQTPRLSDSCVSSTKKDSEPINSCGLRQRCPLSSCDSISKNVALISCKDHERTSNAFLNALAGHIKKTRVAASTLSRDVRGEDHHPAVACLLPTH